MKKIISLVLFVVAMSVSNFVSAQGYYGEHRLPARGYADAHSYAWSSGRSGVNRHYAPRQGRGYREPSTVAKVAYVASEILRGIVIADRIFAPYCTENYYNYFDSHEPNRWVYGRPGMPFWPKRYMNNDPFYWYPTMCGNVAFYTSTNCMLGVTLDNQVQLIRDNNTLYIWNTRGGLMAKQDLYSGCHTHFEMNTSGGTRLVEIFYDGVCRVNYVDTAGNVIESYEIY